MARIRSIKPEFFTSLTIGALSPFARLTFIGLWTYVDDDGRGIDDSRLIRAAIWPLDDRLPTAVDADLVELAAAGLLRRYTVGGRAYLYVTGWPEHQKVSHPRQSRYPAPPNDLAKSPEPSGNSPEDSGAAPPRASAEQGAGSREEVGRKEGGAGEVEPDPIPADPTRQAMLLIRTANAAMRQAPNIDQQLLTPIPEGHGTLQNVLDWLASGIPFPVVQAAIVAEATRYEPNDEYPQIERMTYFERPVKRAFNDWKAGRLVLPDLPAPSHAGSAPSSNGRGGRKSKQPSGQYVGTTTTPEFNE